MFPLPGRSILAALLGGWQSALRRPRKIAERRTCPPAELRRNAKEIGIMPTDLNSSRAVNPCYRELLPWRLRRLGMDPGITHNSSYRDLERVCAACTAWQACAYDLAKGRVQAGMRSYCRNARIIDALSRGIASS